MKLIKNDNEFVLENNNKKLHIFYGGNGDLYYVIDVGSLVQENIEYDFIITKENYALYNLFDNIYEDIKNIKIFDEIENDKDKYILHNYSNYNELFNMDTKTITWYSDEAPRKVSNIFKMEKLDDEYRLSFKMQPYIEGYGMDFHSYGRIPIRICNSGSRYNPFNVVFMKMYNSLKNIDDTNDYGHQIHMEEYLYNKKKVLKKRTKS